MNEILLNILAAITTGVLLPLISYLGVKLTNFLNSKITSEKNKTLLIGATTIITNAVRTVFQTYVETLKAEGNFTKEAQLIALQKAKDIVLAELSEEIKEYIIKNFGDLDSYVTNEIEASINLLKTE